MEIRGKEEILHRESCGTHHLESGGTEDRLSRQSVDAASIEVLKARSDGGLSDLMQLKMSLLGTSSWKWIILKVASDPTHSMIIFLTFCIHPQCFSKAS